MARHDSSARRYAEAAFQLAVRDADIDGWRKDLATAVTALGEPRVARVLADRGLAIEARQHLVEAVVGAAVRAPVRNLALLLLRRGRLESLPAVVAEFTRLDNARQGIITATATSAAPLEPAEVRDLTARLEQLSGGHIELRQTVDPSLLGGIQVRLGDRLIDGSVRGRLERLRHRLASGAL
jgi:F-type H+-transporting ATPase subunit delta